MITLSGCETESHQIEQTPEQLFKQAFTFEDFKDSPALQKDDLTIDWSSFISRKLDASIFYEFSVINKSNSLLNIEGYVSKMSYRLLARFNADDQPEYFLAEMLPTTTNISKDLSYLDISDYSGMVYVLDLTGKKIARETYENGTLQIKAVENGINQVLLPRSPSKCAILDGLESVNCSGAGGCSTSTVTVQHWEYFYDVTYYENTGQIIDVVYSHRESRGQTVQQVTNCSPTTTPPATHTNAESIESNPPEILSNDSEAEGAIPPDCDSFKFQKLENVSWQESLVEGLYFKITLVQTAPIKIKVLHTIKFPQGIKFGVPTVDRLGNRVSPGMAASITANAIHQTMKQIRNTYGNQELSTSFVRTKFQELLGNNYPDYTGGGRINFNDMTSTMQPTEYKATWNPNPFNCD
ncbi:hypothetical protein [Aquimarina sp. 2201CG5-10]|uniref:hypothetical protein n=1 Tax=Aquimarina callyspongiae TaxID=3098150 RepID=UPI002AB4A725|nr:hypothetical protein [Aquimarina sp. 2201CG5-10]MDY8137513.1 hypothetical protein [Aquimarina sp. 2201CG5-10]